MGFVVFLVSVYVLLCITSCVFAHSPTVSMFVLSVHVVLRHSPSFLLPLRTRWSDHCMIQLQGNYTAASYGDTAITWHCMLPDATTCARVTGHSINVCSSKNRGLIKQRKT